jgi:ABC-type dipeptide/oligopeptide/nickel transport system permease component
MRLREFIIRRLLLLIPVIFGVLLISFVLSHAVGDPIYAYVTPHTPRWEYPIIAAQHHLYDWLPIQFFYYIVGLFQGDWGYSTSASLPVTDAIAAYFPATMELAIVAIIMAVAIGIPIGIQSAIKKDKSVDHVLRVFSLSGVSMPIFWFALILQYFLCYQLLISGSPFYFPFYQRGSAATIAFMNAHRITGLYIIDSLLWGRFDLFLDSLWHIFLPAFCLAFSMLATISRMMRSSMLEVMKQDYITLARSKGLTERVVIYRHAMRNALIPTVTVGGLMFAGLLGGAVLTETIFAWPGIGRWSTGAMLNADIGGIMGFVLISGFIYAFANLIVDIMYGFLDPRVRYG